MHIGSRRISASDPVYIIAELGVNHDGSIDRALELVDAAADSGADAIKMQIFRAGLLMSRASRLAAYQQAAGETDPADMLRRLELPDDDMQRIIERAHARGIHAIATVFSLELVERASRQPWDAFKTASPDIIHRPLLTALAAAGKPLIVSTGASTMSEVHRAAEWLAPARDRIAFLQCVSSYPARDEDAAVGAIASLMQDLQLPIGYSDHTRGESTGALAVRCGACILEKHLTYSRDAKGPDHAASLEPRGFREYTRRARHAWTDRAETIQLSAAERAMMGNTGKRVQDCEQDVRRVSRQSIVAARRIKQGERFTTDMLTYKRPGTGIEPWRAGELLARSAARDIEADTPINDGDLR
jgi:sialic acid synthase SpsE